MRAGQFMRSDHHNRPILWDGYKCGEGGAVGTSHKIQTAQHIAPIALQAPNRNKPPPKRPETNNPNPQNFPANCYVFVT